jgi:hypothetical protein
MLTFPHQTWLTFWGTVRVANLAGVRSSVLSDQESDEKGAVSAPLTSREPKYAFGRFSRQNASPTNR